MRPCVFRLLLTVGYSTCLSLAGANFPVIRLHDPGCPVVIPFGFSRSCFPGCPAAKIGGTDWPPELKIVNGGEGRASGVCGGRAGTMEEV